MNLAERTIHPVQPEEVMALQDGELESADAARVEEHLRGCSECRALAAEFSLLSDRMKLWQIPPVMNPPPSLANLERERGQHSPRRIPFRGLAARMWWVPLSAVAVLLLVLTQAQRESRLLGFAGTAPAAGEVGQGTTEQQAPPVSGFSTDMMGGNARLRGLPQEERSRAGDVVGAVRNDNGVPVAGLLAPGTGRFQGDMKAGPMVIRTVALLISAKEYESARAGLDRILVTHGGFAAQLTTANRPGQAQALEATLRVPADRLAGVVADLKKLGRVESESHNGEEVTQQYADLNARLSNARHTEQRLIAVLQQRTGKVADVLEVEQEIARVREEIERMDAQRRTMENQVRLATITLQLREEYRASLDVAPPTLGTRLWNALAEGLRTAAGTLLDVVIFFLAAGPSLLLWVAILFWPARVAWRRFRPASATPAG